MNANEVGEDVDHLRTRVAELERLLEARERELRDQTTRHEAALAEILHLKRDQEEFEQALLKKKGFLQQILASIPDGIVVADERGKLLMINPAVERIMGKGLPQAPPEQWTDQYGFFLPDTVTPFPVADLPLARAIRGEEVDEAEIYMLQSKRPEGAWLSVSARPLRDEAGRLQGGVAVARDVTAHKRAELRLNAQYAVTRILAGAATLGEATPKIVEAICTSVGWEMGAIWRVDRSAGTIHCLDVWHVPGAQVADFERATRAGVLARGVGLPGRVWQTGEAAWVADVCADPNFPRGPIAALNGLHSAVAFPICFGDEVVGVMEFLNREIRRPDDALLRMMTALGTQIGQLIERRQAEKALRHSESLYHSLVESLPIGIFRKDLQGRFTFGNQRFCDGLSRPLEQILGKTDHDFYPTELADKYAHDDRKVSQTGAIFDDVEGHQKPNGERLFVHVMKVPVFDGKGNIVETQGMFWDETARVLAEENLKRVAQELARSNEELRQFASVASHDLHEPLRAVTSFCRLLQRRCQGQLDTAADEYIGFIVDGATRMQELLEDLLEYTRVGTRGKSFQPTECSAVLDRVLASLRIAVQESAAVVTRDSLPVVLGDATQLAQLFQNLIANAIKFRGQETPRIHFTAERQGSAWLCSVRDNGIGIDPRNAERIFVIFQRLHAREEYEGTGIGLAVCKKIVERHGGRIWVESRLGQGSAFFFTLPAA
jgi:PAS domain S-box-containing protein